MGETAWSPTSTHKDAHTAMKQVNARSNKVRERASVRAVGAAPARATGGAGAARGARGLQGGVARLC